MNVSFDYRDDVVPSPVVSIDLEDPISGRRIESVSALIDSGADRTVIPECLIAQVQPIEVNRSSFVDFLGNLVELPLFQVVLSIPPLSGLVVDVVSSPSREEPLIGRDVLNQYRIVLDGPNLRLEIHDTP